MAEMSEFDLAIAGLVDKLRQIGVPEDRVADTAAAIAADNTPGAVRQAPGAPLEVDIGRRSAPIDLPPVPDVSSFNALAGNERMGRKIQERAMRGLDPTPEQQAYLQSVAPMKEMRGEALGTIGRELTGIPQVGRAVEGISEAIQDPSISNLTNAGVQTGLAAFRPLAAAKALGLGYAAAGASDAGLLDMGAQAQARRRQPQMEFTPLEGLTEAQNSELKKLRETDKSYGWLNNRDRDQGQARIKQLEELSNKYIDTRNTLSAQTANQAEADKVSAYNRAVQTAEAAKAAELARDKRFSDTEVGKMYERFGILTPAMMAFGAGALSKAAGAPNYTVPMAVGAGTGAIGANWPLMYNAYFTEPDNPQRLAYEAYVRELPDSHPDKQKWTQYLETLPKANPLREVASQELYDLIKLAERSGIGALEGLLGGLAGAEATRLPGRALEFAGSIPGRVKAGYRQGQAKANAINVNGPKPAPQPVPDPASQEALTRFREAAARERNLLAGPEGQSLQPPAVRPETGVTVVAPNQLGLGQQDAMQMRARPSVAAHGRIPDQPLGPAALSNQPPSEILKSIQPAQRDVPTSFPARQAAAEAKEVLPQGMVRRDDGIIYWDKGTGKGGHPVENSVLRAMKLENRPAVKPKAQRSSRDEVPEKQSVQIDDMAPMGRRRPTDY